MRVEIQIQQDAALDLQKQLAEPEESRLQNQSGVANLVKDVNKIGLKLQPIHPSQTHPLLVPYFMIEVPDRRTAERVINQLSQNQIVEAAYLHPEESAP